MRAVLAQCQRQNVRARGAPRKRRCRARGVKAGAAFSSRVMFIVRYNELRSVRFSRREASDPPRQTLVRGARHAVTYVDARWRMRFAVPRRYACSRERLNNVDRGDAASRRVAADCPS